MADTPIVEPVVEIIDAQLNSRKNLLRRTLTGGLYLSGFTYNMPYLPYGTDSPDSKAHALRCAELPKNCGGKPLVRVATLQHYTSRDLETRLIQHRRLIFPLVYRIVGNVEDARDVIQDTFAKALQYSYQLKDPDRATHWLSRIASNTAIDFLRRNKRFRASDVEQLADRLVLWEENPEQSILRAERELRLYRALAQLTERERTALVLRDIQDMPAEQVARHMNCAMATVRSHIAIARTKLRRFLG